MISHKFKSTVDQLVNDLVSAYEKGSQKSIKIASSG